MRNLNQWYNRAHECHRSRWEQCRSERSCRDIREMYRGRAHRSPSSERVKPRTPYSSKHRSPHEIDAVPKLLCKQVDSARSSCAALKLQAGDPKRKSYHQHKEAQQHGSWRTLISTYTRICGIIIAHPNETPVNSRKPDVYQLRQRFHWRFTGFSHSLSSERCRSRRWSPRKFL